MKPKKDRRSSNYLQSRNHVLRETCLKFERPPSFSHIAPDRMHQFAFSTRASVTELLVRSQPFYLTKIKYMTYVIIEHARVERAKIKV